MHFHDGTIPKEYTGYITTKMVFIALLLVLLGSALIGAIGMGAAAIPFSEVVRSLAGAATNKRFDIIIWNIRLPQALCAVTAGAGLAVAGAVMQSVLRNPLGSPFTLGISHAAAFGAALSVMVMDGGTMTSSSVGAITITSPMAVTFAAFLFSLLTAGIIIAVSRLRGASPETMVLTGVTLGALFTAGTMFLQYFADDIQLAAMVFWTFGDVGRASWRELLFISLLTAGAFIYFLFNRWNYNALNAGDETARGLGVPVERTRLIGMVVA